ncbi:MAG: cyclic nucleotide-binding domain-containing protein [Xanthomonadales bacterium]|nr:cyclic nucleotide-binding domain-containing protein [Xanthomonadales bacterium]
MPNRIHQVIENSHLFSGLDSGLIENIAASATEKSLGANEILFQKGDRADALWGVLSGRIVIEVRADDGKEMILDEFHTGDVFGEVGVLDFGPRRVEATAACKSKLFRLERSLFIEHLQSNPELCFRVFSLLCEHLRDTTETLEDTALYKLPSRLAKRLLVISGTVASDDGIPELHIVQSDLARMMGVNREAVNRQLRAWEKSGWISIQRQHIKILEKKSLAEFAAPAQSPDSGGWGIDNLSRMLPTVFPMPNEADTIPAHSEKRFAGVLAVSCAEYAFMLKTDSAGAIKRIRTGLAVIEKAISKHNGRLVWNAGERTLAEFHDGISAIEAALDIQSLSELSGPDTEHMDPVFRIGIHSGEVLVSGGQFIGEPVNVAIRLTELAGSSGICFTQQVRDEFEETGQVQFQYLGKHELRNVASPVSVYSARAIPLRKRFLLWIDSLVPRRYRPALGLLGLLAVVAGVWLNGQRSGIGHAPDVLSKSIAVMPFKLEGTVDNTYLADGLAEEIRSALSTMPEARVIGRQSSDYFEQWNASRQEIGEILQVSHVLEGTVSLTGEELKISTRLTDTVNGTEIWQQDYQGSQGNFGDFQSEIVRLTNQSLGNGGDAGQTMVVAPPVSDDIDAYTLYLKARALIHEGTKASLVEALDKLESALAIDPDFVSAHVGMAEAYEKLTSFSGYYQDDWLTESRALAQPHLDRALAIDPENAEAWVLRGGLLIAADPERLKAYETAISLNPNLYTAHMALGIHKMDFLVAWSEVLTHLDRAIEIEPLSVEALTMQVLFLQFIPDRWGEAETTIDEMKLRYPGLPDVKLMEALWLLNLRGQPSKAIPIFQALLKLDPDNYWARNFLTKAWYAIGETERALESPGGKTHWKYVLAPDREESLQLLKNTQEWNPEIDYGRRIISSYAYVMLRDWQSTVDLLEKDAQNLEVFTRTFVANFAQNESPALSLAVAYKKLGNQEMYRKFADLETNAVNIRTDHGRLYNFEYSRAMARLNAMEGKTGEALSELKRLISVGPNDPRELLHPAFDEIRNTPDFRVLENLQLERVNSERSAMDLAPLSKKD